MVYVFTRWEARSYMQELWNTEWQKYIILPGENKTTSCIVRSTHFINGEVLTQWFFFTQFLHCRGIITMDNMEHQLKFCLSVRNTSDTCLDASAGQRRTASEIRFPMFSACRWHAKQVIRSLPSPPDHQPNLLNSEDYMKCYLLDTTSARY